MNKLIIEYEVIDGHIEVSIPGCHSAHLPIPKSGYALFEDETKLKALAHLAMLGLARKLIAHNFPDPVYKAISDADAALYAWACGEFDRKS